MEYDTSRTTQQGQTEFIHNYIGRHAETNNLRKTVGLRNSNVIIIQGIPGIGKSTLLNQLERNVQHECEIFLQCDCRLIEPTPNGLLSALGRCFDNLPPDLEVLVGAINKAKGTVIICLDHYESFQLMDSWLRQTFFPRIQGSFCLIIATRHAPVRQWFIAPELINKVDLVFLGPLNEEESVELLHSYGVPEQLWDKIIQQTHGNPLALKLAAAASKAINPDGFTVAMQDVMQELTERFLSEVTEQGIRDALEKVSVVRRITKSLLRVIHEGGQGPFEDLRKLPFVETWPDGLRIHSAVQQAIASTFRATDPEQYFTARRAAWYQLSEEMRLTPRTELWRTTADMLFLIENPVIREAFFPSGNQGVAVEPAHSSDWDQVKSIILKHDGEAGYDVFYSWWKHNPEAFHVVRDNKGNVSSFYCMAKTDEIDATVYRNDPLLSQWKKHLQYDPVPDKSLVLILRRWLSDTSGEVPSSGQASCWLDIKRTYLELRPKLRRVYLTVADLSPYASVAQQLGFQHLSDHSVQIGKLDFQTAMLDFGPNSVDGWITSLVGEEMGISGNRLVNHNLRSLFINGENIPLTPLEFRLADFFESNIGITVTRETLLTEVWEQIETSGSSNVVDSVVKTLRKKLGPFSKNLETVRGFGYRWSP